MFAKAREDSDSECRRTAKRPRKSSAHPGILKIRLCYLEALGFGNVLRPLFEGVLAHAGLKRCLKPTPEAGT